MKFMIILLLVAATHAVDLRSRSKQKHGDDRTETREQSGGNSAVDKRAPVISTVSPAITPGIEYADSKDSQHEKSPTHQIYATPLPPVSKISDVLTGQGPTFQSAIASHLYAPISVYQPRFGSPATYEVSAPVPSNLAYTEHRVSLQPSQNALQFTQKPFQQSKNQQILVQQPIAYPQTLGPIAQPIYQQIPQLHYQDLPISQFHAPLFPGPQQLYQDQGVHIPQPVQTAKTYTSEPQQEKSQTAQRKVKIQAGINTSEKQLAVQNYVQPQGPVSFAKFSQLQSAPTLQHQQEIQYQVHPQQQELPQTQLQHEQPQAHYQQQLQYQPQQPQYQLIQQPQIQYQAVQQYQVPPQIEQTQQIQPLQYHLHPEQAQQQSQPQVQYHSQPQSQSILQQQHQLQQQQQHQLQQQQQHQQQQQQQQYQQPQYQPQPQPTQQIQIQPAPKATNIAKISYIRPGPVFLQSQLPQSHEAPDYRSNVALPTYPPVQYFGKYAQSIFGNYQH